VAIVALAAVLAAPAAAFAYSSDPTLPCESCHGSSVPTETVNSAAGPHGSFSIASNNCQTCHAVHSATGGILLLPADSIKETCLTCHDASGGSGVYGTIAARGLSVESSHSLDATNNIPGGDAATGGGRVQAFSDMGNLSCADCHSPHGSNVVAPFQSDRWRAGATSGGSFSTKLLKQRPTGAETTVTVYGSDWCAACHRGRPSGGTTHNHPVDSTVSTTTPFDYGRVAVAKTLTSTDTTFGPLGGSNLGYVMPSPRSAEQTGHAPICQQCHEDGRIVGSPGAVATYTVTAADGTVATDTPRFQDFPHEGLNKSLLVERKDDLCLNCHTVESLP
jgi:predicted CXXCH cytochrome family protein